MSNYVEVVGVIELRTNLSTRSVHLFSYSAFLSGTEKGLYVGCYGCIDVNPWQYRMGRPIGRKVLKIMCEKFPRLFGSYYCYLLPKEDGGTFKTLRPIGRPALYIGEISGNLTNALQMAYLIS